MPCASLRADDAFSANHRGRSSSETNPLSLSPFRTQRATSVADRVAAAMDAKMQAWRRKMPSKRALTSTISQLVQQKSVAVLYTPTEVERIKQMTDMIAQATSDYEADEDWDRILRVVDALSSVSNRAVLKESVRYLKLRLGDPSPRVVILALTLTESIVKNCGDLVHQEIATEPFMNEMEALHRTHANKRGRESMEIASRVLDLVQAWGEAFLPFRHEFPLFVDTYHNMRKKGIKFPDQYDESKVPVLTPPPDVPAGGRSGAAGGQSTSSIQAHGSSSIDTSSYSNASSGLGGLSTSELYRVATNVSEMFEDMLFEAQKDASSIGSHGVMEELALEVREIVHRMEGAIPIAVAEEDENLDKYLSVNDDLHAALKEYDALLAGNQHSEEETAAKPKKDASDDIDLIDPFGLNDDLPLQGNQDNQVSSDDDPFADFVRARTGPKKESGATTGEQSKSEVKVKVAPKVPQQDEEDDPFASFVQQRATKLRSNSSNQDAEKDMKPTVVAVPTAHTKDLIDLWDDIPSTTSVPVVSQPAAKPDVWLGDDLLGSSTQPPAVLPTASATVQDPWSGNNSFSKSATSITSFPGPASTTSSTLGASSSDPFDMLDFSTKASISTPAPTNPFDSLQPTSPAEPQQPTQPAASKSFNPFDF
ncbi:gamma adaptin ear containing, arf binding protein [Phytophthora pseudosyringae]|uniref:Gamma adaptin ear containing, arf binding protein n=1 Tax=Phytophthora pseudosyringae TaxID=221518 RepID=A0A8T1VCK4_9STRA|nr:gamma adaptin ear containing, arf binding protein [Phytophthora pseudosyringae]